MSWNLGFAFKKATITIKTIYADKLGLLSIESESYDSIEAVSVEEGIYEDVGIESESYDVIEKI